MASLVGKGLWCELPESFGKNQESFEIGSDLQSVRKTEIVICGLDGHKSTGRGGVKRGSISCECVQGKRQCPAKLKKSESGQKHCTFVLIRGAALFGS